MDLMPWQEEAVAKLDDGKVLYGGVGSGKSIAALAYYAEKEAPASLIVITTANKRDKGDWQRESLLMNIPDLVVDSWNNIGKYIDRKECFFIFDEQRVVGTGAWVKSFIKISKENRWILLTATPGDTWLDYAPVFVANGVYRSISEFKRNHVQYKPFVKYPVVDRYLNTRKLELIRNHILVDMPFPRHTKRFVNWTDVDYPKEMLEKVRKKRWNIFEDQPIRNISEMWSVMRRVTNMDPSRLHKIYDLMKFHERMVVFYNFDYELDILRRLDDKIELFEYNGHHHDPVPGGSGRWIYLVQYASGNEGWNCISTDAMVFYSLTYSYRVFEQCQGRIDRLNTDFTDLYYYPLVSLSVVDQNIRKALLQKESFNIRKISEILGYEESKILAGWGDLG